MNSNAKSTAAANERTFRLVSYVLMFLMLACVVMALGGLIDNLIPEWHSAVIAGVLLIVVIDRLYTYRRFRELQFLTSEWSIAFGTHWLVFVLFIRLLLSYAKGNQAFLADLSLFAHGYLTQFFSPEFIVTLFLAALAWFLSAQFLELLDEIGLDQRLALRDDEGFAQRSIVPAHQRLVSLTFGVGIALVILASLARLNLRATLATLTNPKEFSIVELGRFSIGEAGVLFYFIFGLALLSLSRLMSLQTRWNRQRIPIASNNLVRQWGIYSLVFLLFLALVISLLPAGDSLGFLSLVATLLSFFLSIFAFLAQLILSLILLLLSLPFLLLGQPPPILNRTPIPPVFPTPPPVEATGPPTGNATWELVKSIFLWGSITLLVGFSLVQFIRHHDRLPAALRKARATNWLFLAWQWLRKNIQRTGAGLSQSLTDGWQNIVARLDRRRALPPISLINPRTLDPRRRIYFFYLAMLRRGGEQGLPRKPSQTPAEYAAQLEQAVPTVNEDIDAITEAFVEARYSRQEIDATKADRVKTIWGRIRQALQSQSKDKPSANP